MRMSGRYYVLVKTLLIGVEESFSVFSLSLR